MPTRRELGDWLTGAGGALGRLGCLAAACVVAALGSARAEDAALPPLHLVLSWYAKPDFGGYYAAAELGYWKDLGLTVTIQPGGPNAQVEKRVLTERDTIGTVPADQVLLDVSRGLPVTAINTFMQRDGQIILFHAESPITRIEDLQGHAIFASIGSNFLNFIVWKYHLDHLRVQPHPGSIAAFLHDPAAITHAVIQNEPVYAAQEGVKVRWINLREAGFDSFQVVVAPRELVRTQPEALRRFSLGAYRGWAAFLSNPEPVFARIMRDNPNINEAGMRQSFANIKQFHLVEGAGPPEEGLGTVSAQRWQALLSNLQACGLIRAPVAVTDAFTDQFTPAHVGYQAGPPQP